MRTSWAMAKLDPRRIALASAIAGIAGLCVTIIAVACGPGDLDDLTRGGGFSDADAGATPDDADADAAVCVHAAAPARTTSSDAPNSGDLLFALDDIRFDTSDAHDGGALAPLGLDLDNTCSCAESPSCIAPPDAGPACDLSDGRDNVAGPLIAKLATLTPGFGGPDAFREQIRMGVYDVLVGVNGWNGLPDDPNVIASVRLSSGTEGSQNDAGHPAPAFDGTDVWTIDPTSILDGAGSLGNDCRTSLCVPATVDTLAYVTGGTLVAHLELLPIALETGTGRLAIELVGATLTARITKDGGVFRVSGEIDGRWRVDNLLSSFGAIRDPVTKEPLCNGNELYALVKSTICGAVDLAANPSSDRQAALCEAVSIAVSFTGVSATAGTVYSSDGPNACPGFQDQCPR
jgi:hypothetical protein